MIILDYLYIYFFENGLVVSVQPLYRWGRRQKALKGFPFKAFYLCLVFKQSAKKAPSQNSEGIFFTVPALSHA